LVVSPFEPGECGASSDEGFDDLFTLARGAKD